MFVADPSKGSRHNRGCAVDLSMFELQTGKRAQMPSEYDEFTERAHINYDCATAESKRLREILRRAMEAEGFAGIRARVVALRLPRLEGVSNSECEVF